jgi:hypothetical protein
LEFSADVDIMEKSATIDIFYIQLKVGNSELSADDKQLRNTSRLKISWKNQLTMPSYKISIFGKEPSD